MQDIETAAEAVESERREGPSSALRIGFRIVATLVALWFVALNVFGLMELFISWLPTEKVAEAFGEESSYIEIHRSHFMAIGILSWTIVVAMGVQLRKPRRRVAPLLLVMAVAAAGLVFFAFSGTVREWLVEDVLMVAVPVGAVALVHPSRGRLFSRPAFDRSMIRLTALAGLPWLAYVADNAWKQLISGPSDPHAASEHWALAGLLGVVVLVGSVLGSTDHSGWRLTGWIAAGASIVFGVHSLVFPGPASSLATVWAVAAILWGALFGSAIVRRSRTGTSGSDEASDAGPER